MSRIPLLLCFSILLTCGGVPARAVPPANLLDAIEVDGYPVSAEGLHFAVGSGRRDTVLKLLDRGVSINDGGEWGEPPLLAAIYNMDMVVLLLKRGADVNVVNAQDGKTALYHAARQSNLCLMQMLIARGAKVNVADHEGVTPLHQAAWNDEDCTRLLLDHGAKMDVQDSTGQTPLHAAVIIRRVETVQLLLERGANPNLRSKKGETPLLLAAIDSTVGFGQCGNGYHSVAPEPAVVRALLAKRPALDVCDEAGNTALQRALEAGYDAVAALIEKAGASTKGAKEARLVNAIKRKEFDRALALLREGANPNARDHDGDPVLLLAVGKENLPLVLDLLQRGAEVNARGGYLGRTALMVATDTPEIVEALFKAGADIQAQDKEGDTPFYYALDWDGHPDSIRMFLDRGIPINGRHKGLTWLMWAAKAGNVEAVKVLLERGADIHATDPEGNTALHHTILWTGPDPYRARVHPILELLLAKGANPAARNRAGATPLALAEEDASKLTVADFGFLQARTAATNSATPPP